jgi:hypothetical protein
MILLRHSSTLVPLICLWNARSGPKTDKETAAHCCYPTRGHLRFQSIPDEAASERCQNQTNHERDAPALVGGGNVEASTEYAADPGDTASEQHQERGGKPDQCATDGGGNWSKIGHNDLVCLVVDREKLQEIDAQIANVEAAIISKSQRNRHILPHYFR